jgi:parallel beta-helix repeat protein
VAGNYYIFACANDTGSVAESNTANNCTPTPVVVYTSPKTVFVDQNNLNASDTSCGTSAVPCRTITEGLAAANTGQTVLVNSGSYTEQVSITQNITLASTLKNTAIVQAPAALTADSNGLFTLVNVGGGATATIVNMGVSGPGSSGCDSINYGVFVTNANATIVGNKVMSIRDTPYSGCQNGIAIRFGSKALGFVGHTGTIAYNTISDYQKGGIVVDGIGTNVNVVSNVVTGQNIPAVNGQNGIQISRGAFSLVNGNTVNGSVYGTSLASVSADGILLYDVVGGVTVTNNTVSGNDEGIGIYTDTTNYTTETATNVTIQNNQAINNVYLGIHIDPFSTGNTIWNNTATSNGTWDELDEHPDFTYNNWGTIPSQYNTLGTAGAHVGLVFTY